MEVSFVGIDLAKNVFQLHGEGADGQVLLQRRVHRDRLMREVAALPSCVIGVEACTGAFIGNGSSKLQAIASVSSPRNM